MSLADMARTPSRLRRSEEIVDALRHGSRRRGRLLTLAVRTREDGEEARVAVVASRKVGPAVRRNRAKRLMREAAATIAWRDGLDVVVLAGPQAPSSGLADVRADLERLADRLGARA